VTKDGFRVLSNQNRPIVINGDVAFYLQGRSLSMGCRHRSWALQHLMIQQSSKNQEEISLTAVDALPAQSNNPQVMQGYIEGSNVNAVKEMVRMIEANRGFETYQKVVQTIDELNDKASNQIGSIA